MHSLLFKLLKKRGIEDPTKLTEEERKDFDNWRMILSREELNIEDIKEFCKTQCDIINSKWADYNINNNRKAELIPYWTVYNALLTAIGSPKTAREAVEKQLIQLTK